MKNESLGDQFVKMVYSLIMWSTAIAVVTYVTNVFFSLDAGGRVVMGLVIAAIAMITVGLFAFSLRGARADASWQALLTSVLEHPAQTRINLGSGLKHAVSDLLREPLSDEPLDAVQPEIFKDGRKL